MAVKLDMSKAYDRVEWDFVKKMKLQMGFAQEWVDSIMKCINSVSYAVNINSQKGRIFHPSRGLRQGDPLSPFIFLICSEGLSSLMRSANQVGLVKGARVCRRGPAISHLLFADDCMLFGEATEQGVRNIKAILKEYEGCSGQCVNLNKSTTFYSSNTSEATKTLVEGMLGVRRCSSPEKYLDNISLRLDRWSNRFLSQGGKEVFIKSVLQAIPTYAMYCFLFPKSLCEKIESSLAKFWWQKGAGKRDCSFRDSRLGRSSSYVWRSIWAAKASLEKGLIWKVGSGEEISVFDDAWIPNYESVRLTSLIDNLHLVKVADLIKDDQREWNRRLIESTFSVVEAELILQIPLAKEPHADLLVWKGELSGEFSVRSSYQLLQKNDSTAYALQDIYKRFYNKLLKIDIPLKIKLFIWKVSLNYLPTGMNLTIRNI
ncbi:reverse transcriptase [Gossypium australe]|uniref:Reverse transcriptase n=1 Tax=Gossypium australe TaxID=47621 RepID=A0A5B6X718_9ROSI|nr:reverse transcriptase [Gossypium australe]